MIEHVVNHLLPVHRAIFLNQWRSNSNQRNTACLTKPYATKIASTGIKLFADSRPWLPKVSASTLHRASDIAAVKQSTRGIAVDFTLGDSSASCVDMGTDFEAALVSSHHGPVEISGDAHRNCLIMAGLMIVAVFIIDTLVVALRPSEPRGLPASFLTGDGRQPIKA